MPVNHRSQPGCISNTPKLLVLVLVFSLFLSGCASRLSKLEKLPASFNVDGTWQFVSQDEASYKRFTRRARQATAKITAELIQRGESRAAREQAEPDRMLLDVLVSLLSLPRNELFFNQTPRTIEIDYGVAGYHVFPIGESTELLMGGAELDAVAGWDKGNLVVHIRVTNDFDIYQRFRLMDNLNLLETMEITLENGRTISHERWYRR
jgi:hypothetical protein